MTDLAVARALHILGVVIWIGGVFMATVVFLPAVRRGDLGPDKFSVFHAIESRFIWIARAAVLTVGASGYYMLEKLDLWYRFQDLAWWWMHAMVFVWGLFAFVLFIGEPFILKRYFPIWVQKTPERAFATLHVAHVVLLSLSIVAILGSAAGAH